MYIFLTKRITKRNCIQKKVLKSVSAPEQKSYRLVLREANILPPANDDGNKNNKENTKLNDLLLFFKKKDWKNRQKVMLSC